MNKKTKKNNSMKVPIYVRRVFSLQNQKEKVLEVKLDYAGLFIPCALALWCSFN